MRALNQGDCLRKSCNETCRSPWLRVTLCASMRWTVQPSTTSPSSARIFCPPSFRLSSATERFPLLHQQSERVLVGLRRSYDNRRRNLNFPGGRLNWASALFEQRAADSVVQSGQVYALHRPSLRGIGACWRSGARLRALRGAGPYIAHLGSLRRHSVRVPVPRQHRRQRDHDACKPRQPAGSLSCLLYRRHSLGLSG